MDSRGPFKSKILPLKQSARSHRNPTELDGPFQFLPKIDGGLLLGDQQQTYQPRPLQHWFFSEAMSTKHKTHQPQIIFPWVPWGFWKRNKNMFLCVFPLRLLETKNRTSTPGEGCGRCLDGNRRCQVAIWLRASAEAARLEPPAFRLEIR